MITAQRQHLRYAVRIEVDIEWNTTTLRVPISDISLGGLFMRTSEVLTVDSELEARLLLDNPISIRCKVRHVIPGRGMGVQFLNLAGSSRAELERFLTKLAVSIPSSR
jgi:c-di-GMP-binding flagellar brake protein YcgR